MLVSASKSNFQELKSTNGVSGWEKAKDAVCLVGSGKTLQQCKDKIRNLNDVYKSTKDQNKKLERPFILQKWVRGLQLLILDVPEFDLNNIIGTIHSERTQTSYNWFIVFPG